MKILMAASELAPFARTGGFADTVADLASHTASGGNEVTVVLPFYRCIRESKELKPRRTKMRLQITLGSARLTSDVWEAAGPGGVRLLFVERDEFFDRTGLYGMDGRDYQDNAARFIFFSKCVTEIARVLLPDIVHVLGWQPALVPVFIREQRLPLVSVLTPCSLEYQGNFWSHDFALTNLPGDYFSAGALEFYGSMNFLKAGIILADSVVLPGGRYVAAMQTPEYGCGLENILREHADKLDGIAPGAPLAAGLGDDELSLVKMSAAETRAARASFFVGADKSQTPLFLVDTASTGEAGINVLLEALDELPAGTALMVIFGPAPDSCRMNLETSLRRHAQGFVHVREPNKKQITAALAAADYFLVPATLDPQGGLLRAAIKNGVIPVIEQCPGLHGIVRDYDPVTGEGNGLVFYRHAKAALLDAMLRAVLLPNDARDQLSQRCQAMDFSWTASAAGYALIFDRLLRGANRRAA